MPTPDSAAFISTSTQAVNCAQANQTTTVSTLMNVLTVISCCSQLSEGAPLGSGHPTNITSAPGTPTRSTASATKARKALTKSPAVRPRLGRGCGVRFRGGCGSGGLVEREVVRAMAGVLVSGGEEWREEGPGETTE